MDNENKIVSDERVLTENENSYQEVYTDYIDFLLYGTSDEDIQF